jgi:hypothetical protein
MSSASDGLDDFDAVSRRQPVPGMGVLGQQFAIDFHGVTPPREPEQFDQVGGSQSVGHLAGLAVQ